jgi:hypothetical protein
MHTTLLSSSGMTKRLDRMEEASLPFDEAVRLTLQHRAHP